MYQQTTNTICVTLSTLFLGQPIRRIVNFAFLNYFSCSSNAFICFILFMVRVIKLKNESALVGGSWPAGRTFDDACYKVVARPLKFVFRLKQICGTMFQ